MKITTKKQLKKKIEKLEWIIECQKRSMEDLNDFIRKNCEPCPDCGYYGLDCHNYQG